MKKENLLKITDLRHELHMYPELSMQERETADRIKMFLTNNTHFRIVDRRFVSGDWSTDNVDRGDWFADRGAGRGTWFYAITLTAGLLTEGTGLLTQVLTSGTGLVTTLTEELTEETGFTRLKRGVNPGRRSRSVRTWMPCRLWKMTP